MAALNTARNTPRMGQTRGRGSLAIAASTTVFQGGIVCRNGSGLAVPGSTSTTIKALGIATETTSSGMVPYERGVFHFGNSAAGDALTDADIGNDCYMVDDQTVAKTDDTGARSRAGVVRDVDASGVWVEFD